MLPLEERKGAGRLLKSSPFLCDCMVSKRTRYADRESPLLRYMYRRRPSPGTSPPISKSSFIQTPSVNRPECGLVTASSALASPSQIESPFRLLDDGRRMANPH